MPTLGAAGHTRVPGGSAWAPPRALGGAPGPVSGSSRRSVSGHSTWARGPVGGHCWLSCVSSCSRDRVLHPGTSRPSPCTGLPPTVIQNLDLLLPELPLRARGHPKTADGCWVARPSPLTRLDEGAGGPSLEPTGEPHTVRASSVRAEGQIHAVLHPSASGAPGGPSCCCCWPLGTASAEWPQPGMAALLPPRPPCSPGPGARVSCRPGGQGVHCPFWSGSVVTAVLTSRAPAGSTTRLPALSRSPRRRARGERTPGSAAWAQHPCPREVGQGGQGWDTSPLLTFPKWMKQGDLRGGGARGFLKCTPGWAEPRLLSSC